MGARALLKRFPSDPAKKQPFVRPANLLPKVPVPPVQRTVNRFTSHLKKTNTPVQSARLPLRSKNPKAAAFVPPPLKRTPSKLGRGLSRRDLHRMNKRTSSLPGLS